MKSEGLAGLTTVSVDWEEPAVIILDQTQLPNREAYLRLYTPEEIWEAIYHLKVRGAPAIGVAAAYGMAVCAQQFGEQSFSVFFQKFTEVKKYLASSRPTAVNKIAAGGGSYPGRGCGCLPEYRGMGIKCFTTGNGAADSL